MCAKAHVLASETPLRRLTHADALAGQRQRQTQMLNPKP